MNRQASKGMTLIELMVVVVIVAILASIAYPSYRQYTIRANRTEAKTEMLQLSQVLEKCFTRNNTYDGCPALTELPIVTQHYTITAAVEDDEFTLMAAPRGGQADDTKCGSLALDSRGVRLENASEAVDPANKCW